jgi:tetratricopeptide (TPR) repeat protein
MAVRDTVDLLRPDDPGVPVERALALAMGGYLQGARSVLEPSLASSEGDLSWGTWVDAVILVLSGSLDEADRSFARVDELVGRYGSPSDRIHLGLARPWVTGLIRGEPERARAQLSEHLVRVDLSSVSPFNRNYPEVALTHVMLGDTVNAKAALAAYRSEAASVPDPQARSQVQITEALLGIRSRVPDGVRRLESAVLSDRCARCRDFYLGYGYELAGAREQAIEAWERFLAFPFYDGGDFVMQLFNSTTHERLGRLHDEAGHAERAADHYRRFAAFWADADPALQARVRYALERAAALAPARP